MAEGNPSLAIAIAALFLAVSMGGAVYYISTTMTNGNDSIDDNDEIEPEPEPEPEPPIECSEDEREVLDDNLSKVVGCEKIIAPHNATFEQQSITITRGNTITINWLAADIRKNLINIETLAQVVEDVSLHSHTEEAKDSNDNQKLDEIHSTLIDIGNALSLDFANRITGMKEQEDELKGAKSRRRFRSRRSTRGSR